MVPSQVIWEKALNARSKAPAPPPVPYAVSGPYVTQLPPQQESQFQSWVKQNNIPFDPSPTSDYDMRGYYKDNVLGIGGVKTKVSAFDGRPHFPDTYKTPYHKTFSNESKYATKDAPHWEGDRLISKDGRILADESPNPASATVVAQPSPSIQTQSPDLSGIQLPPVAQQPPGQMATPAQPIPPQHLSAWHRAAQALMGNSTSYVPDPANPNGPPKEVTTPNKPGQLFRSILAGAIMGGAAGAESHTGNGWGAAAIGGKAAMQNQQQQQEMQRQVARQKWEDQQKAQEQDTRNQLMKAQIASFESESMARHATLDLQDKEYHDKHNAASAALYSNLVDAGGVSPIDKRLPGEMTTQDLMAKYTKDPSVRQAPEGYVRHFIDQSDASEMNWNGVHWTHPDGSPVDMSDKTTVKVVDVPQNAMTTKRPVSGKDINTIYGQNVVDPSKTYPVAPLDLVNARATALKDAREQAQIDLDKKKVGIAASQVNIEAQRLNHEISVENRNEFQGADKQISQQISTLQKRASDPFISPEVKAHIDKQIDGANAELKKIREKLYPGTKIADIEGEKEDILHPDVAAAYMKTPGADQSTADALSRMSADEIIAQVNSSTTLSAEAKKAILAPLTKSTPPPKSIWNSQGQAVGNFVKKAAAAASTVPIP